MTRYGTGINGRMSAVTISERNRCWLEMHAARQATSMAASLREMVPGHLTSEDVWEIDAQRKKGQSIDKDLAQLLDLLLAKTRKKYGEQAKSLSRSSVMDFLITRARTKSDGRQS